MTEPLKFILPFPPSVNEYYRSVVRGKYASNIKSKKARAYPGMVKQAIGFWPHEPLTGDLLVLVDLYLPDRRRRDVDNYLKGLNDALTAAHIWVDDEQIVHQEVKKWRIGTTYASELRGKAVVTIIELNEPSGNVVQT